MKYTSKDSSPTKKTYTVTVDEAELKVAQTAAVSKLAKTVKVQGFREGNVPMNVAKKHLDPMQLANETLENAINIALNDIVSKEAVRVLDRPEIDVKSFEPYTSLKFTADIDVLGDITLGDYKKLKAEKETVTVEKSEIDTVLERMQQGFADKNEVKREAKDGDELVIDFDGKDKEGKQIEGAKGEDYSLQLGSKTFIPGFEEQLVGHKTGETFDIKVTFPDDYHAEHLKSAEVTFTVTIKKVIEVVLPKVDDDFAKKAGPFESAKELKADVKRELISQKEHSVADKYKDALLGELVGASDIPTPEILIQDQLQSLEQDMTQNLMYRGMTIEQYIASEGYDSKETWREKELKPAAERRVKSGLALAELSKVENIEVSKDELEAALAQKKAEAPKMAEQLDSADSRRDLANRLITEKTLLRIIELNAKK